MTRRDVRAALTDLQILANFQVADRARIFGLHAQLCAAPP
jgi:hypothetical protein